MEGPLRLLTIFGDEYLSTAITKIHLDGSSVKPGDGKVLGRIFQRSNLVELGFKRCSYVGVDELNRNLEGADDDDQGDGDFFIRDYES